MREAMGTASLSSSSRLPSRSRFKRGKPGKIAVRACEGGNETRPHRDAAGGHHVRDRAGCVLDCLRRWRPPRHNDVHLELHQVGGEFREPRGPLCNPAVLERKIVSLDVAKLAETCP
jgi:hypothetical protein